MPGTSISESAFLAAHVFGQLPSPPCHSKSLDANIFVPQQPNPGEWLPSLLPKSPADQGPTTWRLFSRSLDIDHRSPRAVSLLPLRYESSRSDDDRSTRKTGIVAARIAIGPHKARSARSEIIRVRAIQPTMANFHIPDNIRVSNAVFPI